MLIKLSILSESDLVYFNIACLLLAFGWIHKYIKSPNGRKLFGITLGLGFYIYLFKWYVLISFSSVVLTYALLNKWPRRGYQCSFVVSLLFLFALSYIRISPGNTLPDPVFTVQMLLLFRLIGFSFQWHDDWLLKMNTVTPSNQPHHPVSNSEKDIPTSSRISARFDKPYSIDETSFFDFLSYCYCFVGMYFGPTYDYITYRRTIDDSQLHTYRTSPFALRYFLICIVFFILNYLISVYFPISFLYSTDYLYNTSLLFKIPRLFITFSQVRYRYYLIFTLSDLIAIHAGFGYHEAVKTDTITHHSKEKHSMKSVKAKHFSANPPSHSIKSETPRSQHIAHFGAHPTPFTNGVDIVDVEFNTRLSSLLRHWNKSNQQWLATFIYRRVPSSSRFVRQFATFAFSSIWHGIHPGYFSLFLVMPLLIMAESPIERWSRHLVPQPYRSAAGCVLLHTSLKYFAMGFILLNWENAMKFWKSTYFLGHWILLMILIIGYFPIKKSKKVHGIPNGSIDSVQSAGTTSTKK